MGGVVEVGFWVVGLIIVGWDIFPAGLAEAEVTNFILILYFIVSELNSLNSLHSIDNQTTSVIL